jgi:bifunctional UDP-N-acetylglucosamine pyrophosphorylase/glucosamine-1-phosphate N-acetyltransferase
MKVLVLAAGKSVSLVPFSVNRSAPMIQLCGRSVLEQTLDLLRQAGLGDVVLVIDAQSERIPAALGDGSRYGLSLQYIRQRREGIGGAILDAEEAMQSGEHFLLVYADTITRRNIFSLALQSHHAHRGPVAAVCLTEFPERYGTIYMTGEMRITEIIERPREALGNYVLAGVYVLPRTFFAHLHETQGQMNDAMARLLAREGLFASIWEDEWVDLRYPWDILTANRMIMGGWTEARVAATAKISEMAVVSGPVIIGDGAEVKAGAVLQGPCYVGPHCFIGNNVLLRSYTSLGNHSVIGFGVELKNSVLMDGSRVGRLSFIGDSVIGEGVDIGAGTMTINRELDDRVIEVPIGARRVSTHLSKVGAFIGDRATLGAGHTLAPGTVVGVAAVVPSRTSYRNA